MLRASSEMNFQLLRSIFTFKKNTSESGQRAKTWERVLIAKYGISRMKYPRQGTKLLAKN